MFRFYRCSVFLAVLLGLLTAQVTFAATEQPIPPGFNRLRLEGGVALFRKNYPNGSPDYVQVADLSRGAQVFVLHGKISGGGNDQGVYGGDNPRFVRKPIEQFWKDLSALSDGAFCVSNGQFFRLADSPTPLPFPLKKDGQVLTDGYGEKEFPGQKLILEIWPDRVDIRELSRENLYGSSAPDIIAGLTEDAEKASKKAVGRTFVGVRDQDGDRIYETLLILNTRTAKPSAVAEVLRGFGAHKVMMLDGGGSTQLVCDQQAFIDTDRLIPQAIGIAAGKLAPYTAAISTPEQFMIAIAGETTSFDLRLRNTGEQPWKPGEVVLKLSAQNANLPTQLNLSAEVAPEDTTTLSLPLSGLSETGLIPIAVRMEHQGQAFSGSEAELSLVVVPKALEEQLPALRASLESWSASGQDISAAVQTWIDENQPRLAIFERDAAPAKPGQTGELKLDLTYAAIIPLMMVPMFVLVVYSILSGQRDEFSPDYTSEFYE